MTATDDSHDRRPAADPGDTRVSRPPPVCPRGWASLDPPDDPDPGAVTMSDPTTWPMPDVLPLVLRTAGALFPETGLLVAGRGPVVYLANAHEPALDRRLKTCDRLTFPTYRDIAGAGWEID